MALVHDQWVCCVYRGLLVLYHSCEWALNRVYGGPLLPGSLKEYFSKYGEVADINLKYDQATKKSRCVIAAASFERQTQLEASHFASASFPQGIWICGVF